MAVSSYDTFPADVKRLPSVGALLDPNVERILSLKPDLVIVYGSQVDLKRSSAGPASACSITVMPGLPTSRRRFEALGERTGDAAKARELADRIEQGLRDIRARVRDVPGRAPWSSSAASGWRCADSTPAAASAFSTTCSTWRAGRTSSMTSGCRPSRPSTEQILAKRPDVILEVRAANSAFPSGDRASELSVWKALSAVPAVRNDRVHFLFDDRIVIPGPRVVEGRRHGAGAAPGIPRPAPKMKILLSWSSGKDSAWALHVLRREGARSPGC